jgi:hypothetical protein
MTYAWKHGKQKKHDTYLKLMLPINEDHRRFVPPKKMPEDAAVFLSFIFATKNGAI